MTFQQLKNLRSDHLQIAHDLTFYPYQEKISDQILTALARNLNIVTEEDIKDLELFELAIEISRQAGKTTAIVHTIELIMTFVSEIYSRPISIGLFAPQIEQARTDFERLKNALRPIKEVMVQDDEQKQNIKERENAKTLVLPNGSSCWIAPVTTTSKPESKTFDVMLFEEAQDLEDKIVKERIWPIGATTNAPRIYIGTAGTQLCYFKDLGTTKNSIKIYFEEIIKQRREVYKKTGNPKHLIYEQTVKQEIAKHGIESDEIQRPYFGKWLIGTGQFTTEEELNTLYGDHDITITKEGKCYVGIDTAKHPDSTVVTIIQEKDKKRRLLNWMELRGENYEDQFHAIISFINQYKIEAIAIDSTGQGDFMPDLFENKTIWQDEDTGLYRIKFSMMSKDLLYRNLKATIKATLTALPKTSIKEADRFRSQMLNLQQEYKGQYLSVKHPDDPNAHDDYPDSWALAEWAWARWNEETVGIATVEYDKKEKVKDDEIEAAVVGNEDSDW